MFVRNSIIYHDIGANNQTAYSFFFFEMWIVLFKRQYRMHRSLKQEGTRRVQLTGTGRQKGGMFRESTGPVDNVPSDAPLCGNRNRTEQGVPGQPSG
jgi:hypothetical protein